MNNKTTQTLNRLEYHYLAILRQDLLQKSSHLSIMSIPKLNKITLCTRVPEDKLQRKQLALEILCGQKAVHFESHTAGFTNMSKVTRRLTGEFSSRRDGTKLRFHKGMKQPQYYLQTTLRGPLLFQFLEKLNTVWFYQKIQIQFKNNTVEFTAPYAILQSFPEIQNNFGQLSIYNVQIILHTSCKNEKETRLFCSGIFAMHKNGLNSRLS